MMAEAHAKDDPKPSMTMLKTKPQKTKVQPEKNKYRRMLIGQGKGKVQPKTKAQPSRKTKVQPKWKAQPSRKTKVQPKTKAQPSRKTTAKSTPAQHRPSKYAVLRKELDCLRARDCERDDLQQTMINELQMVFKDVIEDLKDQGMKFRTGTHNYLDGPNGLQVPLHATKEKVHMTTKS